MNSKANLYKRSDPNKAPKPKEYDPEKELTEQQRRDRAIFKAFQEFEDGGTRSR